MKKILILFAILSVSLTACGTDENAAEVISDTTSEAAVTNIVTNPVTTVTTVTTEPETTESHIIEKQTDNGTVKLIGSRDYGYLEVTGDWEYFDHAYWYDSNSRISMGYYNSEKSISEIAESDYNKYIDESPDMEMTECEFNGYKAYKITDKQLYENGRCGYSARWYFENDDGKKCVISFYSETGEEFIEMSDDIMETYHFSE